LLTRKVLVGAVVALMILGSTAPITFAKGVNVISVTFTEIGLPSGTSWSVTFNGVSQASTSTTDVFTGQGQVNCLSWSTASAITTGLNVQYATAQTSGCMNTSGSPTVQDSQSIVYKKQVQVTFSVTGGGSLNVGTGFYDAGSSFVITGFPSTGQAFSSWKSSSSSITIAKTTSDSTVLTISSSSTGGTVTATFKAAKTTITFTEVGLPASTTWGVTFNGVSSTSSTTTMKFSFSGTGCPGWSASAVPAGAGVQYASNPAGGSICPVPTYTTQELVYAKQDQVTMAVSPSGQGSTSPSGTSYYNDGSQIVITAFGNSGTKFSSWTSSTGSITFASSTTASTVATIGGPGTITANFVAASPCTTCTVTFHEVGLPSGTPWSMSFGGVGYTSTTSTITINNVPAGCCISYAPLASISGGSGIAYTATSGATSMNVGYPQITQAIQYVKQYLVTFNVSPAGAGSVYTPLWGYCTIPASGWVTAGSTLLMTGCPATGHVASSWKSSTTMIKVLNAKSPTSAATVNGPGTITVTFKQPTTTFTFVESGLPASTIWSVTFDGVAYFSTSGSPTTITITKVAYGGHSWSLSGPENPLSGAVGVQYSAIQTSASPSVPQQTTQQILFIQQYLVTFAVSPSSSGTIFYGVPYPYFLPTCTPYQGSTTTSISAYCNAGLVVAIESYATSGFSLTGWTSSTGSITIASASSRATAATIGGSGTITGDF
jgi:Divergent InlB B-repeat domain